MSLKIRAEKKRKEKVKVDLDQYNNQHNANRVRGMFTEGGNSYVLGVRRAQCIMELTT